MHRTEIVAWPFAVSKFFCVAAAGLMLANGCVVPERSPRPSPSPTPTPATRIALQQVADGFAAPVAMEVPPDGTGRIFIADQPGRIFIVTTDGQKLDQPFLDITDRMVNVGRDDGSGPRYDERGLLGLAFHPDYARNGRFFVYYSAPKEDTDPAEFDSESHLSEFHVSDNDPNQADKSSERLLLAVNEPQLNHNGGQLAFGPEGYLYLSLGDGGGANDAGSNNDDLGHNPETGNGQDLTTLLGKLLRLDVDSGDPYGIPSGNRFATDDQAMPEIFAYGFRNPWRFSFDSAGRLFLADVGQGLWEEVNLITKGGGNYGWRVREGTHCFDKNASDVSPTACTDLAANGDALIDPIIEYPHCAVSQNCKEGDIFGLSVTGGYLYEGAAIPGLLTDYVFGDWSTSFGAADGTLFAARPDGSGKWQMRVLDVAGTQDGRLGRYVTSFGRDADGELYVLTSESSIPAGTSGAVFKIVAAE